MGAATYLRYKKINNTLPTAARGIIPTIPKIPPQYPPTSTNPMTVTG